MKTEGCPELLDLLKIMIERDASDLHITTGSPPRLRIVGKLVPVEDCPSLTPEDTKALCYSILTPAQKKKFEDTNELDLSFSAKGLSRCRANIFMQRGAVAGAFRAIPFNIKTFQELGLPSVVEQLIRKPQGLLLVTGAPGSGKSTTLASMIDRINSEREAHIVTIEDPIEFLYSHKKCLINQREINSDTISFRQALKFILRQDPDIVMIGEMSGRGTVETALNISGTGHLTLASMHTTSAVQTINRIIEIFQPHQQEQARIQLSSVLEGIITQQLVPRRDGQGRVLALEIFVPSPALRNLMRENNLQQIYSMMQSGHKGQELQTMNHSLCELCAKGLISYEEAVKYSPASDELKHMHCKRKAQAKSCPI